MKELKNEQDYLRDVFEHAPIGFHAFGPDRKFIEVNQTELDMLEYSKAEIVGKKTWTDLIIPSEIPLFEQHWKIINSKGEVKNLSYTVISKSGRKLKVLLNATARFDVSGQLMNTRGSIVDVTELHQMDLALKTSKAKIGRQKLALDKNNMILLNFWEQKENDRRQMRHSVQKNIEETIFPLVEKLKRRGSSLDKRYLTLLEKHLMDLSGSFSSRLMESRWRLSSREVEICKMLKNGLKTKDISDLLSTSMRTVEHHRSHIRKKLKIPQSVELSAFLQDFLI